VIEIERRFLCRIADVEMLSGVPRWQIRQGYLTDREPSVRIRRREDEYILTFKAGHGIVRREVELSVPPESGAELMDMAGEHRLDKVRYQVGRWEIDLFEGKLTGLVLAEIELSSIEETLPPIPVGMELCREVTEEGAFTNQRLALLGEESARRFVDQVKKMK
jgi:CYTH domain-containing protein